MGSVRRPHAVLFAPADAHGALALADVLGDQSLLGLVVDPFATAVNELPAYPLHWVKIFMAHFENGRRISELQLNNVDWPDHSKREAFQWPAHRSMLGLRFFACAVDRSRLGRPAVRSIDADLTSQN
jgi:hypothetical protein